MVEKFLELIPVKGKTGSDEDFLNVWHFFANMKWPGKKVWVCEWRWAGYGGKKWCCS
jgi:hypothetical protein